MLALRLARGERAGALLRRVPPAAATACVSSLLLTALGHALSHPQRPGDSLTRLLWCLVPLAASARLAALLARTQPGGRSRAGLAAAGAGPGRLALLAASSTVLSGLLGSALALTVYLRLRARLSGTPHGDGHAGAAVARQLLAEGRPLPSAGVLTLLCLPPLVAGVAAGLAARARTGRDRVREGGPRQHRSPAETAAEAPAGAASETASDAAGGAGAARRRSFLRALPLPCGLALIALGAAAEAAARRRAAGGGHGAHPGQPPHHLADFGPLVLGGWLFVAAGLLLCAPGLARLCGLLLTVQRPGAARLLAGRTLQRDAARLGPPLGLLCTAAATGAVLARLYVAGRGPGGEPGQHAALPRLATASVLLVLLGAGVVVCCVLAGALLASAEARAARAPTGLLLARLGAPPRVHRAVGAWRTAALALALIPLTAAAGYCAALPLTASG